MRELIRYIIQEISYLPSDLRRWRRDERAAGDKMMEELRKWK